MDTIIATKNFDAYLEWLKDQQCADCGSRYADRPRDSDGNASDSWATETLCGACWKQRCRPVGIGEQG